MHHLLRGSLSTFSAWPVQIHVPSRCETRQKNMGCRTWHSTTHQRRWKVQQWRKSTGKSGTYSSYFTVNECTWCSLYRYLWDWSMIMIIIPSRCKPTNSSDWDKKRPVQDWCVGNSPRPCPGHVWRPSEWHQNVFLSLNSKSSIVAWC